MKGALRAAVIIISFGGATGRRLVKFPGVAAFDSEQDAERRRLLAAPATSADEHLVRSLPGLSSSAFKSRHWAGYVPVSGGKLFYWLFEAANQPQDAPLVIWLNGGPGCSSMDGLFLENGPFKLRDANNVKVNPYSWHNAAHMLYIDQPVGTGLSFTTSNSYADNEGQVDFRMFEFLQHFFALHTGFIASQCARGAVGADSSGRKCSRPLYLTGESHAGHYIPSMISYILKHNADAPTVGIADPVFIDVRGAAIGNGWTDPWYQYDVSEYAFGQGLIGEGQLRTLKMRELECRDKIASGRYKESVCFSLMDDIIDSSGSGAGSVVSMYDTRLYDSQDSYPPGHEVVEQYLNRDQVRAAIHATECPSRFVECSDAPYVHLAKWDGLGVTSELVYSLEAGVRFLFYNGQYDLICNHVGNEKFLSLLQWSGASAYNAASRSVWMSRRNSGARGPAGYVQSADNGLQFVLVLDAGHMVPMDVPAAALDLLTRFVHGQSFADSPQGLLPSAGGTWAGHCASYEGGSAACKGGSGGSGAVLVPESEGGAPAPPVINSRVRVGYDSAVVQFEPSVGEVTAVSYEVISSPHGIRGSGTESPVLVTGLSPGTAYTFQVVALSADGQRSAFSGGSAAATPGCVPQSSPPVDRPCGAHGICAVVDVGAVLATIDVLPVADALPDGPRCVCAEAYTGPACEYLDNTRNSGGARGGSTGGGGGGDGQLIKALVAEPAPEGSGCEGGSSGGTSNSCVFGLDFAFPPATFGDDGFVGAITQLPGDASDASGLPTGTLADSRRRGFVELLIADLAAALGLNPDLLTLASVIPRSDGGAGAAASAIDIRVLAVTKDPAALGRHASAQWDTATSSLHSGLLTRLIDYSAGGRLRYAGGLEVVTGRSGGAATTPAGRGAGASRLDRVGGGMLALVVVLSAACLSYVSWVSCRWRRSPLGSKENANSARSSSIGGSSSSKGAYELVDPSPSAAEAGALRASGPASGRSAWRVP